MGALSIGGVVVSTARAQQAADTSGDDAGGEGMHGRHLDRILDKVGASASQRSQIHAIWDGLRPQLQAQHQQRATLRKQIVADLTAQTIDANAIEQLRQQSMAVADKLSSLFTQGIVQTAQVLSPDQRKLAQQEMSKHAQRFGGQMP
jgi:Spy/CpxP family protein refolding chaperone